MTDTSHDMEPFNLQFPFTRTLGSTLSTFFSALAEGQLIGVNVNGRVIAPPLEYDPETGADAGTDYVKVGPKGTVSTWTWVPEPTHLHPLDEPFAFAFITLDGADTPDDPPGAGGRGRAAERPPRRGPVQAGGRGQRAHRRHRRLRAGGRPGAQRRCRRPVRRSRRARDPDAGLVLRPRVHRQRLAVDPAVAGVPPRREAHRPGVPRVQPQLRRAPGACAASTPSSSTTAPSSRCSARAWSPTSR